MQPSWSYVNIIINLPKLWLLILLCVGVTGAGAGPGLGVHDDVYQILSIDDCLMTRAIVCSLLKSMIKGHVNVELLLKLNPTTTTETDWNWSKHKLLEKSIWYRDREKQRHWEFRRTKIRIAHSQNRILSNTRLTSRLLNTRHPSEKLF